MTTEQLTLSVGQEGARLRGPGLHAPHTAHWSRSGNSRHKICPPRTCELWKKFFGKRVFTSVIRLKTYGEIRMGPNSSDRSPHERRE